MKTPNKNIKNKTKKKSNSLTTKHLPTKPKAVKNTPAYYQCMCDKSKQGLHGKKITQVAHDCKNNKELVIAHRNKQIKTLSKAYKQLGTALESLLP